MKIFLTLLMTILSFHSEGSSLFNLGSYHFNQSFSKLNSQNTIVMSVAQDSKGKIWIGGDFGLKVFTGQKYINIDTVGNKTISYVRSLYVDEQDTIWIGTKNKGILALPQNLGETPQHYSPENSSLPDSYIRAVEGNRNGKIWIGTGNGLSELDLKSKQLSKVKISGLPTSELKTVIRTLSFNDGLLWVGTSKGLVTLSTLKLNIAAKLTDFGGDISAVLATDTNDVWLGKTDGTAYYKSSDSSKFESLNLKALSQLNPKFRINHIANFSSNEIGIVTNNSGLIIVDIKSKALININKVSLRGEISIENKFLEYLFLDRNQYLWLAGRSGIVNISKEHQSHRIITKENSELLSSNDIGAFEQAPNGDVFIAQRSGSIAYFSPQNNYEYREAVIKFNETLNHKTLVSMALNNGNLYVGTTNDFLYSMNLDTQIIKQYTDAEGLLNFHVRAIFVDQFEHIWVGTDQGAYRLEDNTFKSVKKVDNNVFLLLNTTVNGIHGSDNGKIWLATKMGVFEADNISLISKKVLIPNRKNDPAESVFVDSKQRVWIGYGDGVYYANPRHSEKINFQLFNELSGLESMSLGQNFMNSSEGLIITEEGIIDPINLSFYRFANMSFTNMKHTYWNTSKRLNDGTYIYGSSRGISMFKPEILINKDHTLSKPYIENIKLDNEEFIFPNDTDFLVPNDTKVIRVSFNVYDYAYSNNMKYQYILEGFNEKWINAEGGVIELKPSSFSPENYILKVKVALDESKYSKPYSIATITILPRWYQKTWLKILSLFLFIASMAFAYKLRLKSLKSKQKQLEREVKDRTCELTESNRQLLNKNKEIIATQKQLIQSSKMASIGTMTAGVAHEINNPTNFTHAAVYMMQGEIIELKTFLKQLAGGDKAAPEVLQSFEDKFTKLVELTKTASEGTTRIKTIVEDLRTFSRIDDAKQAQVHITNLINSTVHLVQTQYDAIIIDIKLKYDPLLTCFPSKLNQMFMNIIVNACQAIESKKASDKTLEGKVTIKSTKIKDKLVLSFEDNGCGMQEETLQRIFEPFFTTKDVGNGTGLGMAISFGIIDEHGGSINIKSVVDEGTVITISFDV